MQTTAFSPHPTAKLTLLVLVAHNSQYRAWRDEFKKKKKREKYFQGNSQQQTNGIHKGTLCISEALSIVQMSTGGGKKKKQPASAPAT